MPKFLALTPQQAAEVAQFGAEPSEYVFDADTGEAVPKAEVPTAWTEEIGAGLKSILPGVADAVLSPLSLAGQTADLIRQGVGTYDPNNPSHFSQWAKSAKEGVVDLVGEPDPRASWLSSGIGRGLGNLAGIATPAALGRKLTGAAANRLASGLGGAMMAESTIDREMQQQAEAGVQDPVRTALKGAVVGAGGGYLEGALGAGSILRNLTRPTGSLGGRLGRGLAEFGKGGITEGLQQGLENELVTGTLQLGDPNYDPTRAALIGGLVQGPASVALDTLAGGKPAAPAEGTPAPAGEKPTGVAGLKTGRVKPTAAPEDTQGAPTYEPTPGIAEAMLKAGKEWDPPIKTPVDAAYKKLADKNVIVTPEDIHALYNIWGGKAENAKAVETAANGIYSRNVMNDVQKPKSALDVINAELAVRGKYNETRGNLQAELAKLDKKDADLQKAIAENPAAIGTITAANAELARNAAQRKVYEGLLSELDNQEMLELSANQPKLPTKGMANPVIPAGALPGIGETDEYFGPPGRTFGPAIPVTTAPKQPLLLTAPTAVDSSAPTLPKSVSVPVPAQTILPELSPKKILPGVDTLTGSATTGSSAAVPARLLSPAEYASRILEAETAGGILDTEVRDATTGKTTSGVAVPGFGTMVSSKPSIGDRFDTWLEGILTGNSPDAQKDRQQWANLRAAGLTQPRRENATRAMWVQFNNAVSLNLPVNRKGADMLWGGPPPGWMPAEENGVEVYAPPTLAASAQEGEQGSPFGESPQVRYSGFNIRPMLEAGKEALRRGRKWLTPDQVQDGTFMLSGVAGLNYERPWGMQVGKDGSLPVSGLVPKMAANIPKGEMEAYKAAGLEKWLEGKGKVSREELQQWMMENGPVVEVKELRPIGETKLGDSFYTKKHEIDTKYGGRFDAETDVNGNLFFIDYGPGNGVKFRYDPVNNQFVGLTGELGEITTDEHRDLVSLYSIWADVRVADRSNDSTIGRYGVEPRPVEEMEGSVELLVRVPWGQHNPSNNTYDNIQWTGGHHGTSGYNTLGFGRANVETLPDGRKVLHVFEAQSDWGQRVRKEQEEGRSDIPSHPLLDESNRLILKAAIKYALDNNLDGIAISDAETAMITEGHDAAAGMVNRIQPRNIPALVHVTEGQMSSEYGADWADGVFIHVTQSGQNRIVRIDDPSANSDKSDKELALALVSGGYGQKEGAYIPQEGGMRLNYDQKLPKIARELTGHEGERVSFGEHWKAHAGGVAIAPRENLIFKNPDGSPKTDITARVYPLDKARKMFEDQTAFTLFGRDQSYYSGLPLEWVNDLFKSMGLKNLGSPDPLYHLGKSVTSRMATRGPSGGLVKWLFADMTREKQQIANVLTEATEPFREFVGTENGIKWINRASTDETWDDFSGLSKEEIPAAQAYANWWRDVRELITDRGVYVAVIDPKTGEITYRPGKELPGYSAHAVGDQVYEVAGDANRKAEWAQMQEDFIRNWANDFGEGTQEMARTAIANILGVKGMETGPGGEPLFGPVSLPHGMTLPESWRDPRPADSLNRYIRRVSQHLAWAEKVQYNPAARRVFNIKADPMGNSTAKTDPTTWAEAPEAWAYAVREGKRVRADWALNADENNPPDEPIDFAGDSANMNALLSSFKQASSPNPNLQAFSSAASAALMQAPTGLRDVGMSLVRAAQYAGPSAALRASMDYIANIPAKIKEARQAGAMPGDLLEPEIAANSKAIARSMMKLARKMRAWSGREFLDNTGRVIIYDAVRSVILEGNGDHLVKEFGPAYTEGMSKEEIADQTAAVLSHRASNVSDAGSLPAGMLPQGGGLSAPLSLMRWSVAQYNTFAEDVVNPMLDGKGELGMKRFLTLVLGSIVGGSVINGLLDDLLKRKPDHLTWGEWLNVYNDPNVDKATKAKEFAYAAASRAQVMGALGWVGDYLVAPAAREIAGGTRWANQTDIQYPAWIVGTQMAQTIGSYYNAVVNKRTDGRDFLDFLLELGKINQNVRVAHGAIKNMQGEEKKGLRDQGVVERVYGLNSSTGKEAGLETGMGPVFRSDPFNFTRQAMGSEDLGKLEGFLEERRRTGNVPSLDTWSQDRRYYQALTRLIGEEEAKKRREVDRKMDQEVRKKNREIRRLSR